MTRRMQVRRAPASGNNRQRGTTCALIHRVCGHACAVSEDRPGLERMKALFDASGRHEWRVRLVTRDQLEGVLTELLTAQSTDPDREGCPTCKIADFQVLAAEAGVR